MMDKKISIIFITFIFAILIVVGISSAATINSKSFSIKIVEKNPDDWSIIKKGAYGQIFFSKGDRLQFTGFKLSPNTEYTLIYYGANANNDVWPYATCIKKTLSNKYGRFRDIGTFDYSGFVKDNIPQKFWIIKSSDVNCANNQMTAWNPTEYLFEEQTI